MFKKGDLVTVNAMGDSKQGVVMSDTKGSGTRVKVEFNNVIKGKTSSMVMNFGNEMIKLR